MSRKRPRTEVIVDPDEERMMLELYETERIERARWLQEKLREENTDTWKVVARDYDTPREAQGIERYNAPFEEYVLTVPKKGRFEPDPDVNATRAIPYSKFVEWDEIFSTDKDRRYAKLYQSIYNNNSDPYLKVMWLLQLNLWRFAHVYEHPSRRKWDRTNIHTYIARLARLWNKYVLE